MYNSNNSTTLNKEAILRTVYNYGEELYASDLIKFDNIVNKQGVYINDASKVKKQDDKCKNIVNVGLLRFIRYGTKEEFQKHEAKLKILDLKYIKKLANNINAYFYGDNNIDIVALGNKVHVNNLDLFNSDKGIKLFNWIEANEIIINGLDFSTVKSLSDEFSHNRNLETIRFEDIDFSNIKDMTQMFYKCKNLKNIITSNVIPPKKCRIDGMFKGIPHHLIDNLNLEFFDNTEIDEIDNLFGMSVKIYNKKITLYCIKNYKNNDRRLLKEASDNDKKLVEYLDGLNKIKTNNPTIRRGIEKEIDIAKRYLESRGINI